MDWEEIARRTIYHRYGRGIAEVDFRMPSGAVETFALRMDQPNVGVLALTDDDKIVITRQFRPGPRRMMFEMPGGYVDDGESPHDAAARELLEETGYAGEIRIVGRCWPDSYSSAVKYCGVATGCVRVADQASEDASSVGVELVELAEFRRILRSGELVDVDLAYMALDAMGL